jgi:hypothetical protein
MLKKFKDLVEGDVVFSPSTQTELLVFKVAINSKACIWNKQFILVDDFHFIWEKEYEVVRTEPVDVTQKYYHLTNI